MSDNILKIANQVFIDEISALERTQSLINHNFESAVDILANSNKIIVSGVGKSGIIAQKIAATLSSIGISAVFLHPVEALHGDIGMVQKGDVALLISKSGNTEELIRTLPYLKMRSAHIISIVGNLNSHLATNSDIVLDGSVMKEACPFNLAPTTSTTAALVIGDALAVSLMYKKNVTLEDFSRLHPLGQIGKSVRLMVRDVMHKLQDIAIVAKNTPFKDVLIEMTKKPFGCCCCIDEESKLLGIITDGDVRRILQKYDDIRGLIMDDVMTKNPIIIGEQAYLVEALALMENRGSKQISVLPVVCDNKLIGLIRIHDIINN
ncbi:MAG: KpsF/GutQ family sugar-phosphate isomerase [Bacteroidetes bacterium]|nr:KpsF/GutQ family sugar-phosphate isomerase [Bacteroidota bacterium]